MIALLALAALSADDPLDVIVLCGSRPAFVRVHLVSGGGVAFARYDDFLARLFEELDRDGSRALSRAEAGRAPTEHQLNQIFAGSPLLTPTDRPPSADAMDADRDGLVTLDELKAFYAKSGAGPVTTLPTTSAAALAGDRALVSLDADGDGRLSRAELLAADLTLSRFDADEDEFVSVAELGPGLSPGAVLRPALPIDLIRLPRGDGRLTAKMDAARQAIAHYDADKDGRLAADEVRMGPEAFAAMDRNRDGRIDAIEFGRWLTGTPDLTAKVHLTTGRAMMRPVRVGATEVLSGGVFRFGSTQLSVVTSPAAESMVDRRPQVMSAFARADVGGTGVLMGEQLKGPAGAVLRGVFALADRNGDGRLTLGEVNTYATLAAEGVDCQVAVGVSSFGQGVFEALDADGDGFLSIRERRRAWARLAPFDTDGDGVLLRAEVPAQIRLAVGWGGGALNRAVAVAPRSAPTRPVPTRGPLWFRKMDRNGDGDVSPTEWLGELVDFRRADRDGDGLVDADEAEGVK